MIPVGTRVAIDLAWYIDSEDKLQFAHTHGHGQKGTVSEVWQDVDGTWVYDIELEDGEVKGAFNEKDLLIIEGDVDVASQDNI